MRFPFLEHEGEAAALAFLAVHLDAGAVHVGQLLHQREADARAVGGEEVFVHQVLEAHEEGRLPVLGDADALVLHADGDGLLVLVDEDGDGLAVRRVFKGV